MGDSNQQESAPEGRQKLKPLPKRSKTKSKSSKVAPSPPARARVDVESATVQPASGGGTTPLCVTPLKLPKSAEPHWGPEAANKSQPVAGHPSDAHLRAIDGVHDSEQSMESSMKAGPPVPGSRKDSFLDSPASRSRKDSLLESPAGRSRKDSLFSSHMHGFHLSENFTASNLQNYPFMVGDSDMCALGSPKTTLKMKRYYSTSSLTGTIQSPKHILSPSNGRSRKALDELSESTTQVNENIISPKMGFRQNRLGSQGSESWATASAGDPSSPKRTGWSSFRNLYRPRRVLSVDSSEGETERKMRDEENQVAEWNTEMGVESMRGKHWNHWVKAMWFAFQETSRIEENSKQTSVDMERAKSDITASADLMGTVKPKKAENEQWTIQEVALHAVRVQAAMKRQKLWIGMRSRPVLAFDFFCTIHIFLITDTYIISNESPDYDIVLHSMTTVCFVFFVFELCLKAIFHPTYRNTIHIWLETLTILSLLPDVLFAVIGFNIFDTSPDVAGLHASQAFYATFRVFKVFRIVPFLLRLYPHLVLYRKNWEMGSNANEVVIVRDKTQLISEVGLTIDRESMHQTVKICCTMLAVSLASNIAGILNNSNDLEVAVSMFKHSLVFGADMDPKNAFFKSSISAFESALHRTGDTLLFAEANGVVLWGAKDGLEQMRVFPPEGRPHRFPGDEALNISVLIHLGQRERTVRQTGIDMVTSIAIIAVIIVMMYKISMSLTKDVVKPVEGMVSMISDFAHQPLKPIKSQGGSQIYETKMVQRGLHKFAALLQLAFGEAGARVIKDNMEDGVIQTRLPGKIVHGIFGFCDIRKFTDITEVLQAQTAKLVNSVADRVHHNTCATGGAPNKNIGDAFLLVWKPKGNTQVYEVVDGALKSFVSIVIELEKAEDIHEYTNSAEFQQRLPGYKFSLGFGLHYGWAIESAIGSALKIDASYLGPHVNLASRLESATKRYGVSILLSGDTFRLMSKGVQDLCRLVDRVMVQGSQRPLDLYTYDVPNLKSRGGTVEDDYDLTAADLTSFWNVCSPRTSTEFRDRFRDAVNQYLGGQDGTYADWISAYSNLEACLELEPSDGPSRELLKFIHKNRNGYGNAPTKWRGCRILIGK